MTSMSESAMLALVFVTYFTAAFVWPTVRVWRLTKLNPYVLPASDDVYGFVTTSMRALMICLFAYIVGQLVWRDIERDVGALLWLVHAPVRMRWYGDIYLAALPV